MEARIQDDVELHGREYFLRYFQSCRMDLRARTVVVPHDERSRTDKLHLHLGRELHSLLLVEAFVLGILPCSSSRTWIYQLTEAPGFV